MRVILHIRLINNMWKTRGFAITFLVTAFFGSSSSRKSPNADLIEEYYINGPEAGLYSANVLEDALLDVPGLITKYGYPVEVHNVITEDGYILELHRIPRGRSQETPGNRNPTVLIQHGLLSSSADFVITRPGTALAYILADAGFDVWLGNARGNFYSRKHVTLDPDSRETRERFWHFSWEEMGARDIPAMIDHILETTGKSRIHYIGHSQGTTSFFAMGTLRPEYNDKIISMHAYAPVAYMEHNENILFTTLGPYANIIEMLGSLIGYNEILRYNELFATLGRILCADGTYTQIVCSNVIFIIAGGGPQFHNSTLLPAKMGHVPAGAALRQIAHYGQHIRQGFFRRYDHGLLANWNLYWTFTPPSMNLTLITAPVYLHYAEVDTFASLNDVDRLWRELGRPMEKLRVPHIEFGHVDFMWGTEAKSLLYDKTIDLMLSYDDN